MEIVNNIVEEITHEIMEEVKKKNILKRFICLFKSSCCNKVQKKNIKNNNEI